MYCYFGGSRANNKAEHSDQQGKCRSVILFSYSHCNDDPTPKQCQDEVQQNTSSQSVVLISQPNASHHMVATVTVCHMLNVPFIIILNILLNGCLMTVGSFFLLCVPLTDWDVWLMLPPSQHHMPLIQQSASVPVVTHDP